MAAHPLPGRAGLGYSVDKLWATPILGVQVRGDNRKFAVPSSLAAQDWPWKGQQMSAMVDRTPEADTLYIGQGVTIKGAVVVSATVVVDGVLEGDIDVENLFVRAGGTISGRIRVAQNAEILTRGSGFSV